MELPDPHTLMDSTSDSGGTRASPEKILTEADIMMKNPDVNVSPVDVQSTTDCEENTGSENQSDRSDDSHETQGCDRSDTLAVSEVKSKAVMKYAVNDLPNRFTRLQVNTNLKEPPANWLQANSTTQTSLRNMSLGRPANSGYQIHPSANLRHPQQTRSAGSTFNAKAFPSSFKTAYCFPDLAGDVDVISDAENIKKLLKIPWAKGGVSMMVHRIANTILLDEFDIHQHLLRQQRNDWPWLRKFYQDTVLQTDQHSLKDKPAVKKNKSRDHLQNQNMFSKFLYYSVECEDDVEEPTATTSDTSPCPQHQIDRSSTPDPLPQCEPVITEHQRTVDWTFEDIHMLVGTDLPIFGDSTHPCVSLRLRDMRKPINVLTGLDYWLDNLICNVPELAMCFHLDGIVQGYELLKTEDIPSMEDCQFSPHVVRDVAHNILSFLQSNATKEGHTYWLFKGPGDDIVKLYDLSTLCPNESRDIKENPYTVPVGILLYRMARTLWHRYAHKKSAVIRTLLTNCLKLLNKQTHLQVVSSAHHLLSHLYVTDDIHQVELPSPDCDSDTEDEEDPCESQDVEEPGDGSSSVDVENLWMSKHMKKQTYPSRHSPITGSIEERCHEALTHIMQGLECLDVDTAEANQSPEPSEERQRWPNPAEAIPLHYQPTHQPPSTVGKPSDVPHQESGNRQKTPQQMTVYSQSLPVREPWLLTTKYLLMQKAAVCYYDLGKSQQQDKQYIAALANLNMAYTCLACVSHLRKDRGDQDSDVTENHELLCAVLGVIADLHVILALQPPESSVSHQPLPSDATILSSIQREQCEPDELWFPVADQAIDALEKAISAYKLALSCQVAAQKVNTLSKRLANAHNELGVQYMNAAAKVSHSLQGLPTEDMEKLWHLSYGSFEQASKLFESLTDRLNLALLHCNVARLMRQCAQQHADSNPEQTEFTNKEEHYFTKAVESYQQGMQQLQRRETCPEVWDSIRWQLCSTHFYLASLMQDHAPLSSVAHQQVEKKVVEHMNHALKYCDTTVSSPLQATCQFRAATIHHRLASLHHNAFRNQVSEQKRRQVRSLAELHYSKASALFSLLESGVEWLRVQLERFALCEFLLEGQTSAGSRIRTLQTALSLLVECQKPLDLLAQNMESSDQNVEIKSKQVDALTAKDGELNKGASSVQCITKTVCSADGGESCDALSGVAEGIELVISEQSKVEDTSQTTVSDDPPADNKDISQSVDCGDTSATTRNLHSNEDNTLATATSVKVTDNTQCADHTPHVPNDIQEVLGLVNILLSRIRFTVLQLVKVTSVRKSKNPGSGDTVNYKSMYGLTLKVDITPVIPVTELCQQISRLLDQIAQLNSHTAVS